MSSISPWALSRFFVLSCATVAFFPSSSRAQAPNSTSRIALTVQRVSWAPHEDVRGGLLTRELVRQAVLIAARDELGLNTADAVLDETPRAQATERELTFDINVRTPRANWLAITLGAVGIDPRPQGLDKEYAYNQDARHIYESLTRLMEAESRTSFVDVLRAAGTPDETLTDPESAAGADMARIDELLTEMNFISQFLAVRLAHEQLRRAPRSSKLLGAVTRGYANLAFLTQEHWDAGPQVFAARALLYAERHCVVTKDAPAALANRIYARALVGMHELALRGFVRFRDAQGADAALPAWEPIVEAYCRFDGSALASMSKTRSELGELALLLRARVAAAQGDERRLVEATGDAVDVAPEAYGVARPLEDRGSLGVTRLAAAGVLQRLNRKLPERFAASPEVPAASRAFASSAELPGGTDLASLFPPTLPRLADAITQTDVADHGEPSWQVLAGLVREEAFVNTAMYLSVTPAGVAISMADEANAARPLAAGHRYEPFIASFAFDRDREWDEFQKVLEPIDLVDLRPTMDRLYQRLWAVSFPNRELIGQNGFDAAIRQRTFTADEMAAVIRQADTARETSSAVQQDWDTLRGQLAKISPYHPLAVRQTIEKAEQPTPEQLAAWEASAQHDPLTLVTLGAKYQKLEQTEAAIRCLERSISVSPARAAFEALAEVHRAQGREDLWRASLERYLDVEDFGLGHAQVQDKIAKDLLSRGLFSEAEPFARDAAATGAAWAMATASEVCERLQKWDDSEEFIRSVSHGYGRGSRVSWYFWCRRTGRGDEAAALETAKQYLDSARSTRDFYGPDTRLVYELLTNQPAQALEHAELSWQRNNQSYWSLVHAALTAAELANQQRVDEYVAALRRITNLDNPDKERPDRAALEFMVEYLAAAKAPAPSIEQLNACLDPIDPIDPPQRGNLAYFVGRVCELQGHAEAAAHCYRRAVAESSLQLLNVTLAAVRLRALELPAR